MERGLYEELLTQQLTERLSDTPDVPIVRPVDDFDQPHVLSRHLEAAIRRALSEQRDPLQRTDLANRSSLS